MSGSRGWAQTPLTLSSISSPVIGICLAGRPELSESAHFKGIVRLVLL